MANNQNIISAKYLNLHFHLTDHMPRRRKRHFNKMSLVLWIFIGCCLTLFINPLQAQAKELNNATSKGENMLPNDHQMQQQLKGNEAKMMLLDKTNDNGTFKRLQTLENKELEEEEGEGEEEDEHSTEVIEMIQPPHTLRHQEHYKQRILQAAKHENAPKNSHDDKDDEIEEQQERVSSLYNRNLRYKQIQFALREPIASPAPHHKRHEHHLAKQQQQQRMENTWPQQHHLRHQHHQQQQQNLEFHRHYTQPQLRHLNHEMRKQNASTTTKMKTQTHQRYFDRESSYVNPLTRIATTEGPTHLRHTGSNKHWKSITHSSNPHNRLFNDEGYNSQKAEEGEEDIKRFSLSLDGHENEQEMENANKGKESLDDYTIENDDAKEGNANNHINSKDKDNIDNENDDDYSYDDEEDAKEINKQNNFPSITTNTKTNVKRFTNPLRSLYTPASPSKTYLNRSPTFNHHHLRHSHSNKDIMKTNSNPNNNDDDDNDDYDDIENNEDDLAISSSYESSDDEDDKMSDEKWNKIEHEHYRKQMQHQRAMQALRLRRPQNDNNPQTTITTTAKSNKYSLYSPSSLSAPSTFNTAWTKRQTINDDGEGENIYSRSYVPGSVTRKKEEELGTPAAVLESRRQYALQQRQNKALASAHHRRIVTEGICRLPQPRVERIRRDSWKIYTPHCTILHRCADDAGCCPSERQTCAPKRTKNVDLYFFVISLNETQGSVEKLTFVNHTECHCVDRSKQRAPEYATSGARDLMTLNNQIPFLRRATILNCYCPNLFEKILQEDGYCRCDCSSGNMGCDWLKRGMEHFSMNDRKCIIEGRCKLPTCEYGQYVKKHGRCPRREERHLSADLDW